MTDRIFDRVRAIDTHMDLEAGLTPHPADFAERAFKGIPEAIIEKVLFGTAAERHGIQ